MQIATVIVLLILGWGVARDAGRGLAPALFRRMDPATAGTVGFLIRLVTIVVALLVGLSVAGVEERTLALGGAFTAVVLGLAGTADARQPDRGHGAAQCRPLPRR